MREHSKDLLAAELRKVGLHDLAERAAEGLYHDYLSPLPAPAMQLAADLAVAVASGVPGAHELRQRHLGGEFDATDDESDEWWEGEEGQALAREFGGGSDDDD